MNILPAIVFGGPPHAGKSVLFYSLTQALREQGIKHYALRACPDGEGDWFHEGKDVIVHDLRKKVKREGKWQEHYVQRIADDISRRHLPLLVDMGGRPQGNQPILIDRCTHSVLLFRPDKQEDNENWRSLVKTRGVLPLAELTSILDSPSEITHEKGTIIGTINNLNRGSRAQGPVFDLLLDRIIALFRYTQADLDQVMWEQAPTELVLSLDQMIATFKFASAKWEPHMLSRLLHEEVPTNTPLSIYGRGPNWLYAALAALSPEKDFYQFDPRLGWVAPPSLQIGAHTSTDLSVQFRYIKDATILSIKLMDDHLDYLLIEDFVLPPVSSHNGLILDGRLPHWLTTALTRLYLSSGVPWIAFHQPQLLSAVVVASRVPDYPVGTLLDFPYEK